MSDLTAKFSTLESQLADQSAATATALLGIQAALDFINTQLDTQTINNAANTRYLLSALGTLNPCTDCDNTSLVVPPTDTEGVELNEDLCKRVQAFIHAMESVYTVLDTMSAFGVGFSTTILQNAFQEVITALENGDETPLPSFPEMVQLVGDGVSYIASNLFVGHTLVGLFAPLVLELVKPMFLAGNAAGAQSVFNNVMDESGYGTFEVPILKHAAYNSLYSYYFDPASAPNLAGYDGTVCYTGIPEITECTDFESHTITIGGVSFQVVQVPPLGSLVPWSNLGDIFGFTFQVVDPSPPGSALGVYAVVPGPAENLFFFATYGEAAKTIIGHPTEFSIRTPAGESSTTHFTVRICPLS